jgi:Spore Coat Protein U domain.
LTDGSALSDTKVGDITQNCNKKAGYTLKVESDNCVATLGRQPVLLPSDPRANSDKQSYTFGLVTDGTTENPIATTSCGMTIAVNGKQSNRVTEVRISIPANETPVAADTYSDVLSVTLTAL